MATRCETVLKCIKDRVIELNFNLISDESSSSFDYSFDELLSNSNDNGAESLLKLDLHKCFITRESSGAGLLSEELKTSTPNTIEDLSGDNVSSSSFKPSKSKRRPDKDKPFICNICKIGFVHEYSYKRHLLKHEDASSLKCPACGKDFSRKNSLNRHVQNQHMPGKLYTCGQCPKIFRSKGGLREHFETKHAKDGNMCCNTCGKRFASKSGYSRHLQSYPSHVHVTSGKRK